MGTGEGPVRTSIEFALALGDGIVLSGGVIAAGVGVLAAVVAVVIALMQYLERKANRGRVARADVLQVLNQGEDIARYVQGRAPLTHAEFAQLDITGVRIAARTLADRNIEETADQLREIAEIVQRLSDAAEPEQSMTVAASAEDSSAKDQRTRSILRQYQITTELIEAIRTLRQRLRSRS